MKLYIYNEDTMEVAYVVSGDTNEECEDKADSLNLDQDLYSWLYNDNNLTITSETKYL